MGTPGTLRRIPRLASQELRRTLGGCRNLPGLLLDRSLSNLLPGAISESICDLLYGDRIARIPFRAEEGVPPVTISATIVRFFWYILLEYILTDESSPIVIV
jgi:hypothetical protein